MMKRKSFAWLSALIGVCVCSSLEIGAPLRAQSADALVMVVNKGNSVQTVSKPDAKRILLGLMTSWPGGTKVTVVLRPHQSAEHIAVLQKICGMNEVQYTRYQLQEEFAGQAVAAVHEEATDGAVKSFVKANAGAVGFVHPAEVDADVKAVLTLD
jgi:ABC-type phosphate transport system substrate-binding protein